MTSSHARVKQRGRSNNEGITLLRMLDSFVNRADFNVLSGDDSSKREHRFLYVDPLVGRDLYAAFAEILVLIHPVNSIARHVLAIAKEIDQVRVHRPTCCTTQIILTFSPIIPLQLPYVARILKSLSYVWSKEDWNNLTGIHSFFLEVRRVCRCGTACA